MKTPLNFCKGFIGPTDINLMQIPRPLKILERLNLTFWGQSASDIRRKLQNLDGAFGMKPSQLVDVSFKVFNREQQQKKEDAKQKRQFSGSSIGFPEGE